MGQKFRRRAAGYFFSMLVMAGAGAAVPLERDVEFRVETAIPSDTTRIEKRLRLVAGSGGAAMLEASLTNTSGNEVRLKELTLTFPWETALRGDAQVAAGGASMFRTPTLVQADLAQPVTSRAFVLSRRGDGASFGFAGLISWKTFWTKMVFRDGRIVVTADGEGRRFRPGETLRLERIWMTEGAHWQDLLFDYADVIVRENAIRLRPAPRYVGWSNWDYYGGRFTYEQLVANLDALAAMKIGANVHQIDGGWWSRCGDYLTPRADLPGGMKQLATEIKRRGMTAGIHLDGMRADQDSRLVTEHPEFFLKDEHGKLLAARAGPTGKNGRAYFDFSHPGARAYMKTVFVTLRRDWGYDYFKIDFLRFGFPEYVLETLGAPAGMTRIVPHDEALTSVERFQLAMAAFREGMGDDAYFLACTAEFGPVFGHVDALRTGGDIDPTYSRFSRSCMENGGNFYLNGKVVHNDADYLVVRGRLDEDAALVKDPRKTGGDMPFGLAEMWTHYVGLFGGPKLSGDNLTILREERKDLFRRAVSLPTCERFVPIDFWSHAKTRDDPFGVFLGEAAGRVYLAVFNWAQRPREFRLAGLSSREADTLEKLGGSATVERSGATTVIALAPQTSVVYRVNEPTPYNHLRRTLGVE